MRRRIMQQDFRTNVELCTEVNALTKYYILQPCDVVLDKMIKILSVMVANNVKVTYFNEEENTYDTVNLLESSFELPKVDLFKVFDERDLMYSKDDIGEDERLGGIAEYRSIEIAEYCNDEERELTLIHELIHAAQYRIPGYEFDYEQEYKKRLHEIEAYSISEYIYFEKYKTTKRINSRR